MQEAVAGHDRGGRRRRGEGWTGRTEEGGQGRRDIGEGGRREDCDVTGLGAGGAAVQPAVTV